MFCLSFSSLSLYLSFPLSLSLCVWVIFVFSCSLSLFHTIYFFFSYKSFLHNIGLFCAIWSLTEPINCFYLIISHHIIFIEQFLYLSRLSQWPNWPILLPFIFNRNSPFSLNCSSYILNIIKHLSFSSCLHSLGSFLLYFIE